MTTPAPDLASLRIDRDAPARGGRFGLRGWVALAAVVVLVGVAALWLARRAEVPAVRVATATLVEGVSGASTGVVANGYVVARTQASVSANVPGRLAYLGVSEGSRVREGQVIARLENDEYQAAVGQAQGALASEQATLIESQAGRDELVREARRADDVRAQNPQLVSPQDVDVADSKAAQGEARVQAEQARVRAAAAALDVAKVTLDNTLIRAPFDGTVLRKEAEVGEVVAPSVGGGLTRGAVVTMADLSTLEVEVDVNEAYIASPPGSQHALPWTRTPTPHSAAACG
jgi:HlyD family secretion protein